MRRLVYRICALFALVVLTSCYTTYFLGYDTYLDRHSTADAPSLDFKDDKFAFSFLPVHNGVYFTIKNLTEDNAYILWDKCYFVEPEGNSFKALNTDILQSSSEVRQKENYESIVPARSTFARFTTSALNVEKFSSYNAQSISRLFVNTRSASLYSSSFVQYKEFLSYGSYWPVYVPDNQIPDQFRLLPEKEKSLYLTTKGVEYVKANDNLGLGLALRIGSETKEYKFNFKFHKVMLFEDEKKPTLVRSATKSSMWQIK